MDKNAEAFCAWALHPARSVEERFTTLLLVEFLEMRITQNFNWERLQAAANARRLDPAWEPVLSEKSVLLVAPHVAGLQEWRIGNMNDRPARDISVLQFLPGLQSVSIDHSAEVADLSPLRHCRALHTLSVRGRVTEDYRPLAQCSALKSLHVYTNFPWPRMEGMEVLEHLEFIHWHGAGTGFLSLRELPALERLHLETGSHHLGGAASLRDFTQLPEMPRLREFWGGGFYYLDGIERYPALTSVMVKGPFSTAAPVTALPRLAHLHIRSDELRDIASLAAAPVLRQLVVQSERPHDYSPLMEAPALCEVLSFDCEIPQLELATLQAILPGWDALCLEPEPRPLKPLRLVRPPEGQNCYCPETPEWPPDPADPIPRDACTFRNVSLWMERRIRAALDAAGLTTDRGFLLGYSMERKVSAHTLFGDPSQSGGVSPIRLLGTQAISRLRDVVDILRGLLASSRRPYTFQIQTNPEPTDDDFGHEWIPSPDWEIQEEHERQRRAEEHRAYLSREFKLQLLREEGGTPGPGQFAATPPKSKAAPAPPAADTPDEDEDDAEEEDGSEEAEGIPFTPPNLDWEQRPPDAGSPGGIKEADPNNPDDDHTEQWIAPPPGVDPKFFWDELHGYLHLNEECLYTNSGNYDILAWLLTRQP